MARWSALSSGSAPTGIVEVGTVLLVAAEKREFDGVLSRMRGLCFLDWPVEFAATGTWENGSLTLTANGPGPELARHAVQTALERGTYGAVVSTGFCGGLDPGLAPGDIVVGTCVIDGARRDRFAALPVESPQPAAQGAVFSSDRVAVTVEEKRRLREQGAVIVEMEAAAVAREAARAGTPFYCIRAVSDGAFEELPMDFNQFRTAAGRFDTGRIAWEACRRPWKHFPALMLLYRNSRLAARRLGEFLAGCRF